MADTKISALAALTAAQTDDTDLLPIVDTSAGANRKMTFGEAKTALSVDAVAAKLAAEAAQAAAEASEDAAAASAAAALVSKTAAESAAEASGDVLFYDTYAAANAAVGGMADLQVVEVFVDETHNNQRTRYRKEGGVLVFKLSIGLARTWFVSNTGSDGNDGKTPATQFLTLAQAASVAIAGDTVKLARGSVFRETASFAAGVVIEPHGNGLRPIITGQDVVSSFSIYNAGPAYTFTIDLPAGAAIRAYPGVWEDGTRLTEVASIAACEALPGSFYFAGPGSYTLGWVAGIKTYYIHPTGSTDPSTNGNVYEAYKREWATNSIGLYRDIRIQSGFHHDGSAQAMEGGSIERLARHGNLPSIPQYKNVTSIGDNPYYAGGGFFHSNPGSLQPDVVYDGCKAVGLSYNGIGFYTHGQTAGDYRRDRATLLNCEAHNVSTCIALEEIENVDVVGFRARNFKKLWKVTTGGTLSMRNVDAKGGTGGVLDGSRLIDEGSATDGLTFIYGSRIEYSAQNMLYNSGAFGPIEAYDSDFILRAAPTAGADSHFAWANAASLNRLWLHRCRLIFTGLGQANWFVNATAAADVQVRDCLLVGGVTDSKINGVTTPLSTLDPDNRAIVISREKAIDSDTPEGGIILKQGAYKPGDFIFSAVAHPGSTLQPRLYVAVGDRIATSSNSMDAWYYRATPASHLNSVCFNNAGSGTCFIAVGDDGLIMKSDLNGTIWSVVGAGVTTKHLRGVWAMAEAGLVVAVGDDGTVLRSTDGGATWAAATTPGTTRTMRSVSSNRAGTIWVAAGDGGYIIRSTDGDTWTESALGTNTWYACYRTGADVQFVVGGDAGSIRTSVDGLTWTVRDANTTNRVTGFAWGEGQTVAVCRQTTTFTDTFLESNDDGATWTVNEMTLPFEVRGIVGPLNPMYSGGVGNNYTYVNMAFMAVGESQACAHRRKKAWSVRRIRDVDTFDRSETLEKHLQTVL